ncbi:MAG TPA: hybrid sensor histidine kinase/response regulator, partial [Chloroflexota bacterium]
MVRVRPRVLIVDDDSSALVAATALLKQQGYEVLGARSVDEASGQLAGPPFDLVLADLAMQRAAGGGLLPELGGYPYQTVSVILTGPADRIRLPEALSEGAYDCLTKPFEAETLKAAAARAIERAALARGTRELLEELESANAQLRALASQLQERIDAATAELRARVEQLGRAKRKIERVRRQREKFIHTIAHDLGAPLTALEGYAAMLADPGVPADVQARARALVAAETQRLARLVGDLADAEQRATGRFRVETRPSDLVEIVRAQVDLARAQTDHHTISAHLPGGPVRAECDPDRLAQVIANLLANAIRYAPGGEIRLRLAAEDGQAWLSVSDDGPGIPAERRSQVFEPGVRLTEVGSGRIRGAGLGLHIARAIVDAHGGRIWI